MPLAKIATLAFRRSKSFKIRCLSVSEKILQKHTLITRKIIFIVPPCTPRVPKVRGTMPPSHPPVALPMSPLVPSLDFHRCTVSHHSHCTKGTSVVSTVISLKLLHTALLPLLTSYVTRSLLVLPVFERHTFPYPILNNHLNISLFYI